tara:strand:+ start:32338 stop:32613 length:276 start_codon:yes stop_codon:yes gene_type:complete
MNRRQFLLDLPIHFILDKPSVIKKHPVDKTLINENIHVFKSKNDKFTSVISYEDYTQSVVLNNAITWYDPITDSNITNYSKNIYILEGNYI